jgi:uncharacterized protein
VTRADLEAMFRIIDASDWDHLGRFFHPELVYDRPGFPLLEGRDANLNFYRNVRAIRGVHSFYNFAIAPDTGACWGRFVGRKVDGQPVDLQFADCYEFRDGLIHRRKSHFYVPLA